MASPAPSCVAALKEASRLYPNRSRLSDGIMGDPRHAGTTSDHNDGNAFDLTHDPANGCDAHAMVRTLVARGDGRVKYAISNGQIWSARYAARGWRRYDGSNPHTKHAHVSIYWKSRDDCRPWWPQPAAPQQEDDMFTDEDRAHLNGIFGTAVNLENFMREQVAFRDEVRARLTELDAGSVTAAEFVEALRVELAD